MHVGIKVIDRITPKPIIGIIISEIGGYWLFVIIIIQQGVDTRIRVYPSSEKVSVYPRCTPYNPGTR
jgi:hypothetical protein